jgi:hypothetical protein
MYPARIGKELVVEVANDIGALHQVGKTVAERGVNILALDTEVHDGHAVIHLITEDNLRAADALRARHYRVREEDVVLVDIPHKPGMLEQLAAKLEKVGVGIRHLEVTGSLGVEQCLVALTCSDNQRAVVALNG